MNTKSIERLFLKSDQSIKQAMEVIDKGAKGIALVVDEKNVLLGIVTDPDVRKAILKGFSLETSVKDIMNEHCTFITSNYARTLIETIFEQKRINQIPVVDDNMKVVDVIMYHEFYDKPKKENWVVIMAGGLGTRLYPLTNEVPKPMLQVGSKPILETIIEQLKSYGYRNIVMCLNYKAEVISNYFQDGSNFGVNIKYVHENKRLGTAGALRLAKKYLEKSFFVINGDILTKLNFEQFMKSHNKNNNLITIGTKNHELQIPYGVINMDEERVVKLEEKPNLKFFISGGMYCLEPETLENIPEDEYFDITKLIDIQLQNNKKVGSFPITEYWMDIGRIQDYHQANQDYGNLFRSEISATKE